MRRMVRIEFEYFIGYDIEGDLFPLPINSPNTFVQGHKLDLIYYVAHQLAVL